MSPRDAKLATVLLLEVVATSVDVGATSSRLTKVARIADLLTRAAPDPELVAIVVAWLSGELPQRQIGVGWASLRSRPPAASQPVLAITGVHATFTEIGAVAGKGSQARRAELLAKLLAAATESEQTFLVRLLSGELRQGALAGIMADAVAKAADIAAAAVQRAAMLGGDLPAVAAAALSGGAVALQAFTLRVGQPVGPMLAQTATSVADALERHGGTTIFEAKLDGARVQIHRAGDAVTVYTRSLDDVTARLPEVVEATLALPVNDLIADGEAIALRPDNRPHRFQVTASRFGRSVDVACSPSGATAFGVLLRHPAPRRRRPAGRADRRAAGRPGRAGAAPAPGRSVDHVGPRRRRGLPGGDAGRRPRGRAGKGAGGARTRPAVAGRAGSRSSRSTRSTLWCLPSNGVRDADAANCPTSTWAHVIRPPANSSWWERLSRA